MFLLLEPPPFTKALTSRRARRTFRGNRKLRNGCTVLRCASSPVGYTLYRCNWNCSFSFVNKTPRYGIYSDSAEHKCHALSFVLPAFYFFSYTLFYIHMNSFYSSNKRFHVLLHAISTLLFRTSRDYVHVNPRFRKFYPATRFSQFRYFVVALTHTIFFLCIVKVRFWINDRGLEFGIHDSKSLQLFKSSICIIIKWLNCVWKSWKVFLSQRSCGPRDKNSHPNSWDYRTLCSDFELDNINCRSSGQVIIARSSGGKPANHEVCAFRLLPGSTHEYHSFYHRKLFVRLR